jgi:hypothetical protein
MHHKQRDYREGWSLPADCRKFGEWGTQRVQLKEVLPWLVCWACRTGTQEFCSALAALVGRVQNYFFQFLCPCRPASWAISRAGSPFSYNVSLVIGFI